MHWYFIGLLEYSYCTKPFVNKTDHEHVLWSTENCQHIRSFWKVETPPASYVLYLDLCSFGLLYVFCWNLNLGSWDHHIVENRIKNKMRQHQFGDNCSLSVSNKVKLVLAGYLSIYLIRYLFISNPELC